MSEVLCVRQDLACGVGSTQGQEKHLCWSNSCADSGDEVANKTARQYITSLDFLLTFINLLGGSLNGLLGLHPYPLETQTGRGYQWREQKKKGVMLKLNALSHQHVCNSKKMKLFLSADSLSDD